MTPRNVKNFLMGGTMVSVGFTIFCLSIWLILDFFRYIGALYTIPILVFMALFVAGGFLFMTYWDKT
jgi:hypothetical protein